MTVPANSFPPRGSGTSLSSPPPDPDRRSRFGGQAQPSFTPDGATPHFRSTIIVQAGAPKEEYDRAIEAGEASGAALENCPRCTALLDVTGCHPLTEATCPTCGALIKVLKQFHYFVLLSELGRGGWGTVYRAFDETLERDVALKLLRNEHTRDRNFVAALEREARITASINHPHVVKVYSTGSKHGHYFIAMEVVSGGTLIDMIDRVGRMKEEESLAIGMQVAEGLQAAYERGLLHRDVKPGNVLLGEGNVAKVVDFGLALPVENAAKDSGDLWGTPAYIAPEKLQRLPEDLRSDIYSLGCTLFHCLAGDTPFGTKSVRELMDEETRGVAPSILTVRPDVSAATAAIITKMLASNPNSRFQSYHELIKHLRYAREQILQPGKPGSAKKRAAKPQADGEGKKKPIWIAVAALVACVAIVGGLFALRQKPGTAAPVDVAQSTVPTTVPAAAAGGQQVTAKAPESSGFQTLDLRSAFTFDTRTMMYPNQGTINMFTLAQSGVIKVGGVPYDVVDPEKTRSGLNIVVLEGHQSPQLFFPKRVELSVPSISARKLHILGGVAGWGWDPPRVIGHFQEPVVKLTLMYRDGTTENFIFSNGVEFANQMLRVDVPGSEYAEGVASPGHQVRTFSVTLSKTVPIVRLILESQNPDIAPIFVAMTAELAKP